MDREAGQVAGGAMLFTTIKHRKGSIYGLYRHPPANMPKTARCKPGAEVTALEDHIKRKRSQPTRA